MIDGCRRTPPPWTKLDEAVAYDGYTRVRRDRYRLPDGSESDWDVLVQPDTVAVLALTTTGKALLFDQYSVGPERVLSELPGGLVDAGESPREAALRELREETGFAPAVDYVAPGEWAGANSTRRKTIVIAVDCARVAEPTWESGETGRVHEVGLERLIAHLFAGDLSDAGEALRALLLFLRADVDHPALARAQKRLGAILAEVLSATPAARAPQPEDPADAAFDAFWELVDLSDGAAGRRDLEDVLVTHPVSPSRAAYERGSLHDSLGEEDAAIPLYRAALADELPAPLRTQATIQLASSLRNVGDASGAIALLRGIPTDDPLADAAAGFLALALHSDDKGTRALEIALRALAPHLPRYRRAVDAYAGELEKPGRVRAISVGILVRDGHVLLEEYAGDEVHGPFLRAPGGGIEFGETASEAVRREWREELDAVVTDAVPLRTSENIFDAHGTRGHEIVHTFRVEAPAFSLPVGARLAVRDSVTTVAWFPVSTLENAGLPVYPPGIVDLVSGVDGAD